MACLGVMEAFHHDIMVPFCSDETATASFSLAWSPVPLQLVVLPCCWYVCHGNKHNRMQMCVLTHYSVRLATEYAVYCVNDVIFSSVSCFVHVFFFFNSFSNIQYTTWWEHLRLNRVLLCTVLVYVVVCERCQYILTNSITGYLHSIHSEVRIRSFCVEEELARWPNHHHSHSLRFSM